MSEPNQKNVFNRSHGWSEDARKILEKNKKEKEIEETKPDFYQTSIKLDREDLAVLVLEVMSDRRIYTPEQVRDKLASEYHTGNLTKVYPYVDKIRSIMKNLRKGDLISDHKGNSYMITDKGYRLYDIAVSKSDWQL